MNDDFLLQKLFNLPTRKERSLTCMRQMDVLLDHPHRAFKSIHVAGTNGKGSVVTKIAKALQEEGFKVGLYTSPHLVDVRERIQINEEHIPKEDFFRILKQLFDLDRYGLSFFDVLTHLAFVYFREKKVDFAVIETGLGGKFDATNIIEPEMAIITSIGFDHMHLLGNTLEEIAEEKRGIVKGNIPVVVGPSAAPFFPNAIVSKSAPFFDLENQEIARSALRLLSISSKAIEKGLMARPLCRFQERIVDDKKVILDVAHNKSGFEKLLEALFYFYPKEKYHFIVSFSKDKDWKACLDKILPYAASITAIESKKPRLESASVLQAYLYCARLGFEDLDSARQSQIEASIARSLQEEHHSQIGKGDDEDRFGKVAASPNLQNLTAHSISSITISSSVLDVLHDAELNIVCGSFYIMDQILTIQRRDGDLGRLTQA